MRLIPDPKLERRCLSQGRGRPYPTISELTEHRMGAIVTGYTAVPATWATAGPGLVGASERMASAVDALCHRLASAEACWGNDDIGRAFFDDDGANAGFGTTRDAVLTELAGMVNVVRVTGGLLSLSGGNYAVAEEASTIGASPPAGVDQNAVMAGDTYRLPPVSPSTGASDPAPSQCVWVLRLLESLVVGCQWPDGSLAGMSAMRDAFRSTGTTIATVAREVESHVGTVTANNSGVAAESFASYAALLQGDGDGGGGLEWLASACTWLGDWFDTLIRQKRAARLQVELSCAYLLAMWASALTVSAFTAGGSVAGATVATEAEGVALRLFLRRLARAVLPAARKGALFGIGLDTAGQAARFHEGLQKGFDLAELGRSAGEGAVAGGVMGGAGSWVTASGRPFATALAASMEAGGFKGGAARFVFMGTTGTAGNVAAQAVFDGGHVDLAQAAEFGFGMAGIESAKGVGKAVANRLHGDRPPLGAFAPAESSADPVLPPADRRVTVVGDDQVDVQTGPAAGRHDPVTDDGAPGSPSSGIGLAGAHVTGGHEEFAPQAVRAESTGGAGAVFHADTEPALLSDPAPPAADLMPGQAGAGRPSIADLLGGESPPTGRAVPAAHPAAVDQHLAGASAHVTDGPAARDLSAPRQVDGAPRTGADLEPPGVTGTAGRDAPPTADAADVSPPAHKGVPRANTAEPIAPVPGRHGADSPAHPGAGDHGPAHLLGAAGSHPPDVPPLTMDSLRASMETGIKDTRPLPGGTIAVSVDLVVFNDGRRVVVKVTSPVAVDAEVLSSLVGRAIDARVPRVIKVDDTTIVMNYVDGVTSHDYNRYSYDPIPANARDGRLLGALDVLVDNGDRGEFNWLINKIGRISGFDHSAAYEGSRRGADPDDRFAGDFVEWTRLPSGRVAVQVKDHPLSHRDIQFMREAIEPLRPAFERLGRSTWYDVTMGRLDRLDEHATGTDPLYDESVLSGETAAPRPDRTGSALADVGRPDPLSRDALLGLGEHLPGRTEHPVPSGRPDGGQLPPAAHQPGVDVPVERPEFANRADMEAVLREAGYPDTAPAPEVPPQILRDLRPADLERPDGGWPVDPTRLAADLHETLRGAHVDGAETLARLHEMRQDPAAVRRVEAAYRQLAGRDLRPDLARAHAEGRLDLDPRPYLPHLLPDAYTAAGSRRSAEVGDPAFAERLGRAIEAGDGAAVSDLLGRTGRVPENNWRLQDAYRAVHGADPIEHIRDRFGRAEADYLAHLLGEGRLETQVLSVEEVASVYERLSHETFGTQHGIDMGVLFGEGEGCSDRAHRMTMKLSEWGFSSRKIFAVRTAPLLSARSAMPAGVTAGWAFHVAPVVRVRHESGQVYEVVIDPTLRRGVLGVDDWLGLMGVGRSDYLRFDTDGTLNEGLRQTLHDMLRTETLRSETALVYTTPQGTYWPDDHTGQSLRDASAVARQHQSAAEHLTRVSEAHELGLRIIQITRGSGWTRLLRSARAVADLVLGDPSFRTLLEDARAGRPWPPAVVTTTGPRGAPLPSAVAKRAYDLIRSTAEPASEPPG